MILPPSVARRCAAVLGLLACASPALGQRRQPEFSQQSILVSNFWVAGDSQTPSLQKNDLKFGREVGDWVRKRVERGLNRREAKVVDDYEMRERVMRAGYQVDDAFTLADLRQQAQVFRADEIVRGTARRLDGGGMRLDAEIVLYRDIRMRQPLTVEGTSFDDAVNRLGVRIHEARVQLNHQRRCENALRDGQVARAVQAARDGIRAYPNGALVRTCLIWTLRATLAPSDQLLAESQRILAIDPVSPHALESAATALDSLQRRDEAASMWLRLLATDTANLELVERVVWSMAEGGSSRRAEPVIVRYAEQYPHNMRLVRHLWRVANDNRNWPVAISAGERLIIMDDEAARDSIFHLRLATAYRSNRQTFKAMEIAARGVAAFPNDARLYALYTQFIKEETDSVIPRGLALFPHSAELQVLNAQDLRGKGQLAQSLDASRKAVELDSTVEQGRLFVAQAELELGRPDSALAMLQQAAAAGDDRNEIAQFALSKGNALFRAANATEKREDFERAMRFLQFADTLKPTPQSKFVLGAAALRVAQTALTEAPKHTVKDQSCTSARLGSDALLVARASLEAGRAVSEEATGQFLEYLEQISPYAEKQIAAFCTTTTNGGPG